MVRPHGPTSTGRRGRQARWRERNLAYDDGRGDPGAKATVALLVTAADKIHNALAIARDLRTFGLASDPRQRVGAVYGHVAPEVSRDALDILGEVLGR